MALTSEKDSYGNIWDSRGFWVGVGENEGEIYSSALGRWISTFDPQADYIMGQPEPKAAPTGGGGSTSPTNVYINQNPGELYQTIVSDGSDGYAAGTVYQVNQLTGAVTVKSRPAASGASLYNDTNSDGYDDQSGLPVGVVASSKSPSGFFYQGKAVNADGSLYQGGDGSGAPQLVNGKYIWDGAKFVVAPGMESTSGSSNISVSGIKSSSSGGGGSSSYNAGNERDYAGEAAANDARRAAENALDREFRAGESALDRALRLQESAAANAQRQEDRRLAAVDTYGRGLTAYDAKAYFDGLQAAGYDINNLLRSGTNLLTNEALTPSAAALGIIRGGVANSGLPATPGVPVGTGEGTATSSVPGQPATPGLPPVASSGPTNPDGTPNMAWQIANQRSKDEAARQAAYAVRSGWEPVATGAGIVYQEFKDGQPTGKQMSSTEYNQYQQMTNPQELGNPSVQEQLANVAQEAMGIAQARTSLTDQGFVSPFNPNNMPTFSGGGSKITWDPVYGYGARPNTTNTTAQTGAGLSPAQMPPLARDISEPQGMIGTAVPFSGGGAYSGPSTGGNTPGAQPGNTVAGTAQPWPVGTPTDSRGVPLLGGSGVTGLPTGTAIYNPDDYTLNGIPARARGGPVSSRGLAVVGDSVSGERTGYEELVIDPTADSTVIPLNQVDHMARGGFMGRGRADWFNRRSLQRTAPMQPVSNAGRQQAMANRVNPRMVQPRTPVNRDPYVSNGPASIPAPVQPSAPTNLSGYGRPPVQRPSIAQNLASYNAKPDPYVQNNLYKPSAPVASTGLTNLGGYSKGITPPSNQPPQMYGDTQQNLDPSNFSGYSTGPYQPSSVPQTGPSNLAGYSKPGGNPDPFQGNFQTGPYVPSAPVQSTGPTNLAGYSKGITPPSVNPPSNQPPPMYGDTQQNLGYPTPAPLYSGPANNGSMYNTPTAPTGPVSPPQAPPSFNVTHGDTQQNLGQSTPPQLTANVNGMQIPRFALGGSMARTGTSVWDTAPTTRVDPTPLITAPTPTAPRRTAPVATTGLPPAVPVTQPATQPVTQPVTQPAATQPVTQPATQPVATQPTIPPAASGVPAQPVASSGLPVTPPPDQALLDEIAQKRRDTILMGGPSPYSLKWGGMSDLYKQTYAENQAQKYGVPAEEIIWQGQQRKGLGGVALSGLSTLGY